MATDDEMKNTDSTIPNSQLSTQNNPEADFVSEIKSIIADGQKNAVTLASRVVVLTY